MKRRPHLLSYPLTIRQVQDYLIFSIKDLHVTVVEPLPANGKISREFLHRVTVRAGETWVKAAKHLQNIQLENKPAPTPSLMAVTTKKGRSKPLTIRQVSSLLGVSENTVRRIPKRALRYWKTHGGHRRYSIGAVKQYQEARDSLGNEEVISAQA